MNIDFRVLRVAKGLRQRDVEARSGISQPRLSLIERGVVPPSRGEEVLLLAGLQLTPRAAERLTRLAAAIRRRTPRR